MNEETLEKIRQAFLGLQLEVNSLKKEVSDLRKKVDGHGTLLIDLRGEVAHEFHTSFTNDLTKE